MFTRQKQDKVPRTLVFGTVTALCLAGALGESEAAGQDLTYTSVTRGEFGGGLGTLMRLVPDAQEPTRETVYLKGSLMRTDEGSTSTILDLGEGRFTHLDHEARTFYSFTMAEMQERMAAAVEEARGAEAAESPERQGAQEPEVTYDVRFSIDRTGQRMSFEGYSAEQVLMVVEVIPRSTDPDAAQEEPGSMVLLSDLWMSTDFPGLAAIREAQAKAAAESMGTGEGGFAAAMQQAFASDPRMQEAFERNAEELQGLDGLAVKTVSYFLLLAPGAELDRAAVLAAADQPLGPGVGEAAAGAAAAGAREAARGAVRGLTRGILGRRQQEEAPPQAEAAPSQSIVLRTTSLVEGVSTGTLSEDLFRPPAGYTEKRPDWGGSSEAH